MQSRGRYCNADMPDVPRRGVIPTQRLSTGVPWADPAWSRICTASLLHIVRALSGVALNIQGRHVQLICDILDSPESLAFEPVSGSATAGRTSRAGRDRAKASASKWTSPYYSSVP